MQENKNVISLYAAGVSPKKRTSFFEAYCDYVSLVRNLEHIVHSRQLRSLAAYTMDNLYNLKAENNPWLEDDITVTHKEAYKYFLENKKEKDGEQYCYVSLNYTSPSRLEDNQDIFASPKSHAIQSRFMSLPSRIERYVVAHRKNALAGKTDFIIGGKYVLQFQDASGELKIEDIFNNVNTVRQFNCMLDMISQLPDDKSKIDNVMRRRVQTETLANELVNPFENMILNALTMMADEGNGIIRTIRGSRSDNNYLFAAEKNGMIPSASRFQEYLNIRHLLMHQWDTLDNLGRFTSYETERSATVRRSYLTSYDRLCGKPLLERITEYIKVIDDFAPLAEGLVKGLLIRRKDESSSKFVERVKAYKRQNPDAPIYVQTSYPEDNERKKNMIKSLGKVAPNAVIIDKVRLDIENFDERIQTHVFRSRFLDTYRNIEYKVCELSILSGKNQPAGQAWEYLRRRKIISDEDLNKWAEYRKLRNEVSHHHTNGETAKYLKDIFPEFLKNSLEIEEKIDKVEPTLNMLEGNICRAVHPDGLTVELNLQTKEVLKVTDANGASLLKENFQKTEHGTFSEEYEGGIRITSQGTKITSCRLPGNLQIDFTRRKIIFPDGCSLYLRGDETYAFKSDAAKIIMDKEFRVLNYIREGKSTSLGKNEKFTVCPFHLIKTDIKGALTEQHWRDDEKKQHRMSLSAAPKSAKLIIDDGTVITLTPEEMSLSHGGVNLDYYTRSDFAAKLLKPITIPPRTPYTR